MDSLHIQIIRADPTEASSVTLTWESSGGCDVIDGFIVIAQAATVSSSQTIITEQVSCSYRYELRVI